MTVVAQLLGIAEDYCNLSWMTLSGELVTQHSGEDLHKSNILLYIHKTKPCHLMLRCEIMQGGEEASLNRDKIFQVEIH